MIKNTFVFTVIVLSLISNPISLQNFNSGIFGNIDGIKPFGGLASQIWAESDEDDEENDDGNDNSEDEEHEDENQDEETEEGASEEDANKAIADAEEEIKKSQEKIMEAKEKGKDTSASELALEQAQNKLEEAQQNLELGAYEMAEESAGEAEDLASDARMSLLGKNVEDEEDSEHDEDEHENDATDEIEDEFEGDEHHEDEFEETEIEVEIKNDMAKIKIEQNRIKSKFLLETTDEAEILSAISQKTGLTESQIQDIWELEVESEDNEDDSDHDKTITQKEAVQEAQSRIAELETQISELEQRIRALLEKLQSGEYFGNIENENDVSKSFSISFDGSAVSMQDESEDILSGEIFLETQFTSQNISKLRVTGGEIIIGDTYYDVMFGKARISSSGPSGIKDSMILIGEVMDHEGNVSTIRLSIKSPVPLDVDFGQEPVGVQISMPSKIAKQWSLEATGQIELL